jgi:hypothetical protein
MGSARKLTGSEQHLLRELARRVAEIAALPIQVERLRLVSDLNSLREKRPVVLSSPEGAWDELVPEASLQCTDALMRAWERDLRQAICRHEWIPADNPILGIIRVPWVIRVGDLGVRTETIGKAAFDRNQGSQAWTAPIRNREDLTKLHFPEIEIDFEQTRADEKLAQEIFGGMLPVRRRFPQWWSYGLTERLLYLRGLQQVLVDLYDNPSLLHDLMAFLRDEALYELETCEREGVLTLNNGGDDVITNGLGATYELPAPGFSGTVRLQDLWVMAESQELGCVGPEHFREFALEYQLPIVTRFGLCAYGCCEPMDRKYDLIIGNIPNLRRVSVSPWADKRLAAEKLADRFIYSWKPNPALLCAPTPFFDAIERDIRETLEVTRGCHLQIMLADTMTLRGEPERLRRWLTIARQAIIDMVPC